MPRPPATSVQAILDDAVTDVVARLAGSVARVVEQRVADEFRRRPAASPKGRGAQKRIARRARGAEITKWIADRRARRVPTFVIEMTGGLDTKKKIVAKYGAGAVFQMGKPPPKPA
jgi:hypothetical protein